MLLGALLGAGASLRFVGEAVAAIGVGVRVSVGAADRGGLLATRARVCADEEDPPRRTWREVRALLAAAELAEEVRGPAQAAFAALADAEGRVHGSDAETVHFHEVGAHDAIGDVVGVCAALASLDLDRLVASPVSVGGGTVRSGHGTLPVPAPAVVQLLRGIPAVGGPVDVELCTPTGAALLRVLVDAWGPMPAMTVGEVGVGAGTRELPDRANVVRLVLGEAPAGAA